MGCQAFLSAGLQAKKKEAGEEADGRSMRQEEVIFHFSFDSSHLSFGRYFFVRVVLCNFVDRF
jgi:hypothetical protein